MLRIRFYICCTNFIRIGEQIRDVTRRGDVIIENFIENDRVYKKMNYKIKHEGWNIIQEHIVLWLDAFIASKPHNNNQYMHIYIYIYTFASPVNCVFEPSKENKSKTINARKKKQGQFWNLHQIPNKSSYPNFRFSFYFFRWLKIFK